MFCLALGTSEGGLEAEMGLVTELLVVEAPEGFTLNDDELFEATKKVVAAAVVDICPEKYGDLTDQFDINPAGAVEAYLARVRADYPVLVDVADDILTDALVFICRDLAAGQDPLTLLDRMGVYLEQYLPSGHGISELEIEDMGDGVSAYGVPIGCPEFFDDFVNL